jgi:DNA-binding response OmpR family regulator
MTQPTPPQPTPPAAALLGPDASCVAQGIGPAPQLAILDQDNAFVQGLRAFLAQHDVCLLHARDPEELLAWIGHGCADVVLLDQRLAGRGGGTMLLRRVAEAAGPPCIMLSGTDDTTDRVLALELGAADHVLKSAEPRELLARIRAVLRRSRRPAVPEQAGGGWRLAPGMPGLIGPDGVRCRLSQFEFALLRCLVEAGGAPVARETLSQVVLRRPPLPRDRAVDRLVARLRRKVEPDPSRPFVVLAHRRAGYFFGGYPDRGSVETAGPPRGAAR